MRIKMGTGKFATKDTLCWYCSRATDSTCPWSEKLMPVDGWDADAVEIKGLYKKDSFFVRKCPLFATYDTRELDDRGVRKLSDAVLASAGRDYLRLMKREQKLRENVKCLDTKRELYGNRGQNIYGHETYDYEIDALERWFESSAAEMFSEETNPIYIMETIKKTIGLKT